MKKLERKRKLALTILIVGIIFFFLCTILLFSGFICYLLIKSEIIYTLDDLRHAPGKVIFLVTLNSLLFGTMIASAIIKIALNPINRIISGMNSLASGDFSVRLNFGRPFASYPTFQDVSGSFNKMAEELENTEVLRSDFINNFSHEFKTPIVSIAGFAKLLKRGNLTDEQKQEYIDIIEMESMRLSVMATNVLNLTRYENQTILTDVTLYNFSEQIRACILTLEEKWVKKKIEFNLNFEEHMIKANKDMLAHLWLNLIDNAIKFSPEGATVNIGIQDMDSSWSIVISNYGADIPSEQQQRIFNKFYQADESHASEGNGIGLALVKGVTKLHKGNVSVNSENGLITFTVQLPKTQ